MKKIASWFGRKEHLFALILGYYLLSLTYITVDIRWFIAFILWLIYHISHRLEKQFYKFGGYR